MPTEYRAEIVRLFRPPRSDGKLTFKFVHFVVRAQFLSEWESTDAMPKFEKAYEVIIPRDVRAKHDAYRYVTESLGNTYFDA